MRDRGSHKPSGSFADFTKRAVNRVKGHCVRCGCGVGPRRKYCPPCAADAYDERLAARRPRYYKPASRVGETREKEG